METSNSVKPTGSAPGFFDKYKIFLITLIVVLFGGYFLNSSLKKPASPPASSDLESSVTADDTGSYYVTIEDNSSDSSKSDIYITDKTTAEKKLFLTTDSVYREHFHNSEFHQGHLYLIKRTGNSEYPSQDWIDELWRYDSSGRGTKLISVQGLTFLVTNNEQYIAIDAYDRIVILDNQGKTVKEYPLGQLSRINQSNIAYHKIETWSQNGQYLWGYSKSLADEISFDVFRINTSDWSVEIYNLTTLNVGDEYAINPDNGLFAYSDYPQIFDADTLDQFNSEQKPVTLHLYDFYNSTDKVITGSVAKKFVPLWIDSRTLEYNDPSSDSRLTYTL